jgi:DNA-binding transcriptional ArsR family regulator
MARAATTADAFNAVAEPRRRQILDVLAGGEYPVNDLVRRLGPAQPNPHAIPADACRGFADNAHYVNLRSITCAAVSAGHQTRGAPSQLPPDSRESLISAALIAGLDEALGER